MCLRLKAEKRPLPQRIRAGCDETSYEEYTHVYTLPQRIRAGCDERLGLVYDFDALCHSAFVRVATAFTSATARHAFFATAHSCGLRPVPSVCVAILSPLPQRIRAGCDTAHMTYRQCTSALPQRIRAGCDEKITPTKRNVAIFATAHSCGLRPFECTTGRVSFRFATAHSCGLRRRLSYQVS